MKKWLIGYTICVGIGLSLVVLGAAFAGPFGGVLGMALTASLVGGFAAITINSLIDQDMGAEKPRSTAAKRSPYPYPRPCPTYRKPLQFTQKKSASFNPETTRTKTIGTTAAASYSPRRLLPSTLKKSNRWMHPFLLFCIAGRGNKVARLPRADASPSNYTARY